MSWRNSFKTALEETALDYSKTESQENRFLLSKSSTYDFETLLRQIGERDAVVDACLPPQLARDLRERNINAVWVPSVLGDGVSDDEIERQLLIRGGPIWDSRKEEKVLLTRDVKFYRRLHKKAILVRYKAGRGNKNEISTKSQLHMQLRNLRDPNEL